MPAADIASRRGPPAATITSSTRVSCPYQDTFPRVVTSGGVLASPQALTLRSGYRFRLLGKAQEMQF